METVKSKYSTCIGPSMVPTLQPGDGIVLQTYACRAAMRAGDVIVYPHPNGTGPVVHRIIEVGREGVTTRGDNNSDVDPCRVRFEDIIGKVTAVQRRKRRIPVRGGSAGFFIHKLMLFRKYVRPWVVLPLRLLSNLLAESGFFHVFHPLLHLRIVRIETSHARRRVLLCGNRAIGRELADSGQWEIRFPYKLFVNQRRLDKAGKNPA